MRFLPCLSVLLLGCTPEAPPDPTEAPIEAYDPLPLVNPFVGTGGVAAQVAGVNPGASAPNGMVLAGPNTRHEDYGAPGFYHFGGYHSDDTHIDGFAHTHAHGIGINDYGGVLVMPRATWDDRWTATNWRTAPFSHDEEQASPGYYAVTLQDDGTDVEIAATTRAAIHRYTFEPGSDPVVVVDLAHTLGSVEVRDAWLEVDSDRGLIDGYQRLAGGYSGRFGGLRTHFSLTAEPQPIGGGTWTDASAPTPGDNRVTGVSVGGWLQFPEGTTEVIVRVGISYVDEQGAVSNRLAEVDTKTFDQVRAETEDLWRDKLSRVRVRGGTESEQRTFHSALYHALLMPSRYDDFDGRYRTIDDRVATIDHPYYSDLSLWDTFRTLHPWYILVYPDLQRDVVKSLLQMTADGGTIPRWPMAHGYTSGMVGTPSDQVLAETFLKGIDGWDAGQAFLDSYAKALGPAPHASRAGIGSYVDKGYVSIEASGTSVSQTLEFAWSDHALAGWAQALGRTEEAAVLAEHSRNWANHWDPEVGFMVGRYDDGSFRALEEGDEFAWLSDYTEGNAYHYLWYVPFDVPGMIDLQHGGDTQAFLDRYATYWDEVRAEPDDQLPDSFYWHGNEPVLHYAYLGSLAGAPDLTAEAARWVMAHRYNDGFEGLDGNDDSGTLSAWYLFSAIGLYPVAGTVDYAVGSPIFERIEVDRGDGTLVIRARGAREAAPYVGSLSVDGEPQHRSVLRHDQLDGELYFQMSMSPGGWLE